MGRKHRQPIPIRRRCRKCGEYCLVDPIVGVLKHKNREGEECWG